MKGDLDKILVQEKTFKSTGHKVKARYCHLTSEGHLVAVVKVLDCQLLIQGEELGSREEAYEEIARLVKENVELINKA